MCTVWKAPQGIREQVRNLSPPRRLDTTVWQGAKPQVVHVCDCSQLPSTAASVRTREPSIPMRRTVYMITVQASIHGLNTELMMLRKICFQNTIQGKYMRQGIDSTSTASLNKAYTTHRYACWCW